MSQDWAVSTREFLDLVKRVGAIPLITVNHGFASYGSLAQATAQLTGDSPRASAQKLNGVGTPYPFGGPLPQDVRPYHLRVGTNAPVRLDLPKYSVTSVLAY